MIPLFQKIQKEGPILSKIYANYLHKIQAKTIVQSITKNVKVARLVKTFFKPEELHELQDFLVAFVLILYNIPFVSFQVLQEPPGVSWKPVPFLRLFQPCYSSVSKYF